MTANQPRGERGPREVREVSKGFINPYNFVGTPPRGGNPGDLGDRRPDGHDSYQPDRFTGYIPITLTTRTPLILADQAQGKPDGDGEPRQVGTRRRGAEGDSPPLLTGSTIKGVLRSAYEAITNSRLGVISTAHKKPVARRQRPDDVLSRRFKPARIIGAATPGGYWAEVVMSLQAIPPTEHPPAPAVWVPKRLGPELARAFGLTLRELDNQEVEAWIHLQHHPRSRVLWRVSDIAPPGHLAPNPSRPEDDARTESDVAPVKVRGHLLWTHSQFPPGGRGKHDERLVVTAVLGGPAHIQLRKLEVPAPEVERYAAVIQSYVDAHAGEDKPTNPKFGSYVWDHKQRWVPLSVGRTLYLETERSSGKVIGLYPAQIGRELDPKTPYELIDPMHRPSTDFEKLSPAERVFGWTHEDPGDQQPSAYRGKLRVAYRGKLRVDPPQLDGDNGTVTELRRPVSLVLSSPKVQQYRFYRERAGVGDSGDDCPAGGSQQYRFYRERAGVGYQPGGRLRGRKFYLPHPQTFDNTSYWNPSVAYEPGTGQPHREYTVSTPSGTGATPGVDKPRVSTVVTHWVPPGVTFKTTIWVENMSRVELAALLWLLDLPEGAVFGVGMGKPLGFGSTRIAADFEKSRLFPTEQMRARYRSLSPNAASPMTPCQIRELVEEFNQLLLRHRGMCKVREQFMDLALGFTGAPVHYPRLGDVHGNPTKPSGTHYEWFQANERSEQPEWLPALGDPAANPTLPYLSPPPKRQGTKQRNAGRPQRSRRER